MTGKRIEIGDSQLSDDLNFLADTDESSAHLKVDELRKKYLMERTEDEEFLASAGNVAERKATSKTSPRYFEAEKKYLDAHLANEIEKAKRYSAGLRVEVWRSKNANRRVGNV